MARAAIKKIEGVTEVAISKQSEEEVTFSVKTRKDLELTAEKVTAVISKIETLKTTSVTAK